MGFRGYGSGAFKIAVFCILFWRTVGLASAQETAEISSDAVRCWWRTDRSSVRVGESLDVVLTCQAVETEEAKVVIKDDELEPSVVALLPYEVLSGERYKDLKKGDLRFFQYRYRLRIIGEDFFGKDVPVPSLDIHFTIDRKLTGLERADTRERVYKLKELPVKVQSLVPNNANDIRDNTIATFGSAEKRHFLASAAFIVAGVFLALSLVVLAVPLVGAIRKLKSRHGNGTLFGTSKILRKVGRELRVVQRARLEKLDLGWDGELIGRVLSACRIVGAISLSRKVGQLSARFETRGLEGQFKLRKGLFRRVKILLCSSLTVEDMKNSQGESLNPAWHGKFVTVFEAFNSARYCTNRPSDQNYDEILDNALLSIRSLVWELFWIRVWLVAKRTLSAHAFFKGRKPQWARR